MRNVKIVGPRLAVAFALTVVPFATACSGVTHTEVAVAGGGATFESGGGRAGGGATFESGAGGGRAGGGARGGAGGTANGGAAGVPSAGSTSSQAGAGGVNVGGTSAAGQPGLAGAMSVGGGASCLVGAPCTCDILTGTTQCGQAGPICNCPPADQCQLKDDPKCFTPCGGDPFGAWVLEGSCYAGASTTQGSCTSFTQATAGKNDLRMRILDGGSFELFGTEDWSMKSRISLGCGSLRSVDACTSAYYSPNAQLFSYSVPASCTANACGACDCTNVSQSQVGANSQFSQWSRDANDNLTLAGVVVPYCVQADELWIGGVAEDGTPKVSYKFKKQSCTGAPVACASRTSAQCETGQNCQLGVCKATVAGREAHCATAPDSGSCGVLQGCAWDVQSCAGEASSTCDFQSCTTEPGCTWGPPVEKCVGDSFCGNRDVADCADLGCNVSKCQSFNLDDVDCQQLPTVSQCAAAPGCMSHPGAQVVCTGLTQCSVQTNDLACQNLGCNNLSVCVGDALPCAQIALADCDRMAGCRREW